MKKNILIMLCLAILIAACEDDNSKDSGIKKEILTGFVQKGPFINGSSIAIVELNNNLDQSGRVYYSVISYNSGKFEIQNVELISNYIFLKADGFYFNENTGENSNTQYTLYAISDISEKYLVNVNILTHLEKNRAEYLIKNESYSFNDAKKEAQKEVIEIFSITKPEMSSSENLDLANNGDDNAILLAITTIIQGYRTTADMSELIANIVTDIKEDGVLNDSTLGSELINDAKLLDFVKIRTNIEKKYHELGMTVIVPDFEKFVKMFIDSTKFISTKSIQYPKTSPYGINILNDSLTTIDYNINENFGYSMAAYLPIGTNLKIILRGGLWWYRAMPNGPINWTISLYSNEIQTFIATESGKNCDLAIQLPYNDTITIEYYENNSITPTKIKQLIIE